MQDKRALGEGRVPVWPLLRSLRVRHKTQLGGDTFRAGPVWVTLLPPRPEFGSLLTTVDRPKVDLGAVLVDLALGLNKAVPQLYYAHEARAHARE